MSNTTGIYKQTPSQTVGPFFAYSLTAEQYGYDFKSGFSASTIEDAAPGKEIRLIGQVFDGAGKVVTDAVIEIVQADSFGNFASKKHAATQKGFKGFARSGTGYDSHQRFDFRCVKPGSIGVDQAPFISVIVHMRGLLNQCFTRIYFDDEAKANAKDAVLKSVPKARRSTLIATKLKLSSGTVYRFDIRMQGDQETVFFDL